MAAVMENWRTQIRKGYLELCLLTLIDARGRLYGFEILELLSSQSLPVKEGTLYPLLSRLTEDGTLRAVWETENLKGHPRKFYSLTASGRRFLEEMRQEFSQMNQALKSFSKPEPLLVSIKKE